MLYCRIKEGSHVDSLKVGEEVAKLGVEHRIIPLEWEEIPPPGKIHMLTRERRYNALLQLCTELDIKVLMLGHHQNDQTGEFGHLYPNTMSCFVLHTWQLTMGPSFVPIPLPSLQYHGLTGICQRTELENLKMTNQN